MLPPEKQKGIRREGDLNPFQASTSEEKEVERIQPCADDHAYDSIIIRLNLN
jgi:hypothetical protein